MSLVKNNCQKSVSLSVYGFYPPKILSYYPLASPLLTFLFPQSLQPADLKYLRRCFCRKYTSLQIIYPDLPTVQCYGWWFQGLKLLHCFEQFTWLLHWTRLPAASRSLWLTSSNTSMCPSASQRLPKWHFEVQERGVKLFPCSARTSLERTFLCCPFFIFLQKSVRVFASTDGLISF